MEIILMGRGEGKTTELIKRSHETNTYILVTTQKRADSVFKQAIDMGYNIPYPITFDGYSRNRFVGTTIRRILVDDADDLLRMVLGFREIDAITMTKQ